VEPKRSNLQTDVLIIGSEGAGSRAAIETAGEGLRTLVVSKGFFTRGGASVTADMDINVPSRDAKAIFGLPGDPADDVESFARDMLEEGKFMNREELVLAHCSNAARSVKELADWGMRVEGLVHSPGHRFPRGILSSGRSMMQTLKKKVEESGVQLLENLMITDLLTERGEVGGAVGVDTRTGDFVVIAAKAVILATGGAMRLFPITTAPEELTGDGFHMAYRAGADLVDMEFPMFLPACLYWPESMKGVDFPYLFSVQVGGWWLNKFGERFIGKWDPTRMERGTTRDVASVAQAMEIMEGRGGPHGGIFVSTKHVPDEIQEYCAEQIPWWRNFIYGQFDLVKFGLDPRQVTYEAGPACHYWNGGIRVSQKGETSVRGLYAVGEAQGGTMGANRLSGNAVAEAVVFGAIAGRQAASYAQDAPLPCVSEEQVTEYRERAYQALARENGVDVFDARKRIQKAASEFVGPARDREGLTSCIKEVEELNKEILPNQTTTSKRRACNREWVMALENESMVLVLELIARASLMREESRGAMYRRDYPDTDNGEWLKNIIVKQGDGRAVLRTQPVVTSEVPLPEREKVPYMIPTWEFDKRF